MGIVPIENKRGSGSADKTLILFDNGNNADKWSDEFVLSSYFTKNGTTTVDTNIVIVPNSTAEVENVNFAKYSTIHIVGIIAENVSRVSFDKTIDISSVQQSGIFALTVFKIGSNYYVRAYVSSTKVGGIDVAQNQLVPYLDLGNAAYSSAIPALRVSKVWLEP